MSDYKKFLLGSQRFIAKLESVAPAIASLKPDDVRFVQDGIRLHYTEIMNATSPAAVVAELRVLCANVAKWKVPGLKPARNRYVKILDSINLDLVEEGELQLAISELRNSFKTVVEQIEATGVPGDSCDDTFGDMLCVKGVKSDKFGLGSIEIASEGIIADASTKPPEPTLRVRLSGDKVKGRTVESGSSCVLIVDWGLLDDTTLLDLAGDELQRAREAKLEVVFVLYRGLFKVEGNRTRIATRFKNDGFETPVQFGLTAPDKLTGPGTPAVKCKLHLEIEIYGRPAVRIPVLLTVVHDSSTVPAGATATPEKVDLDKLIASARRPAPAAVLRINST